MKYLDVGGLAIAAPFLLFPGLFGISSSLSPWIGLGVLSLAWGLRWLATRRGQPSLPANLLIPPLGLALLALLGYAISLAPDWSWNRLWSLVFGLLVYLLVAQAVRRNPLRNRSVGLGLLGLATLAVAAFGLIGTDWSKVRLVDLPWLYDRLPTLLRGLPGSGIDPTSELLNPRWVGITLGFLLPVFWALLLYSPQKRLRLASGALAILGSAVLLLTQAIQGLAGLAAALLFLWIWRTSSRRRWRWLAAGAILALGLFTLLVVFPEQIAGPLLSLDHPLGAAVSLRLDIWSRAWSMLHDMPYTGIGLNSFPLVQSRFYPGFAIGPEPHAHNLYLQTALDFGLPGLFLFLWLVTAWFSSLRRSYAEAQSDNERLLLAGLAACLVSYLAHGFLDALMLGAKPGAALWLILALGAPAPTPKPAPPLPISRRIAPILPLLALVLLITAATLLWPASLPLNQGSLLAHQSLYRIEQGQPVDPQRLTQARASLQLGLNHDPQRVFALDLFGRLAAWQAEPARSLAAFQARLQLDLARPDPLAAYYPPESLLRRARGQPISPAQARADLARVYQAWVIRYPTLAANSLNLALLQRHNGQPGSAAQTLAQAQQHGAQPSSLIDYALDQLAIP